MGKGAELRGAANEVGLTVHLDEGADAAAGVDVGLDQTIGRSAAGLLLGLRQSLLLEDRDRLIDVAACIFECPLIIHDAGPGLLPEILNLSCTNRHDVSSSTVGP